MAIKEDNERITITLTKRQVEWVREQSKRLKIRPSQFIKWLMDKNIANLINRLPQEDLETLIKLAKVKWVGFKDEFDYQMEDSEKMLLNLLRLEIRTYQSLSLLKQEIARICAEMDYNKVNEIERKAQELELD